jgi:putative spermidine/putrescine transport system substrate-binding protein
MEEEPSLIEGPLADSVRAGDSGVDVVLAGIAGLAAGRRAAVWAPLPEVIAAIVPPAIAAAWPPRARAVLPDLEGIAALISAGPGGPVLLHRAAAAPPRNARELLDFARQRPGAFLYARPGVSALGLYFVMALPHMLGDRDPMDPQTGWRLSWEYLEALDPHIAYYPASGQAALEEFAEGGCELAAGTLLTRITGQVRGALPADTRMALLEDAPLLPAAVVLALPRHVPAERLPAIAAFGRSLFAPLVQSRGFGQGVLPGEPPLPGVTPMPLPPEDQAVLDALLPPAQARAVEAARVAPPLGPDYLLRMLRDWDVRIGGRR